MAGLEPALVIPTTPQSSASTIPPHLHKGGLCRLWPLINPSAAGIRLTLFINLYYETPLPNCAVTCTPSSTLGSEGLPLTSTRISFELRLTFRKYPWPLDSPLSWSGDQDPSFVARPPYLVFS